MNKPLNLNLDRTAKVPLAEQIRRGVTTAIAGGVLEPGARLPSWQDLAAQLGVARGTVRTAYEKLAAAQLIEASRATGTRVALRPRAVVKREQPPDVGSFIEIYREMTQGPALFQMGVPAIETFPATLFVRIRAHAVRAEASAPPIYPDPRGELELRREIAGYLAVARGINCPPSQVIVTGGFSAGLGLALSVLGLGGHTAWVENPGFPFTRKGLELARLSLAPIPVDADGIDIDHGLRHHPDAKLVVVTPGQQAPLGPTLSLERRLRLLEWAAANQVWVIEDDYLSELQLVGRAAPALASLDRMRASFTSVRSARRSVRLFGLAFWLRRSTWSLGSRRWQRVSRRPLAPRCNSQPPNSCTRATICAISGAPSAPMPPSGIGAAGLSSSIRRRRSCRRTRLGRAAEIPEGNVGLGRRTRSLGVRHVSGAAFGLVCVA